MRYHIYYHLVQVAKQTDQVKAVYKDVENLKAQFALCPPSNEQMQKLYRLLHDVLLKGNQRYNSCWVHTYVILICIIISFYILASKQPR